MRKGTIIFLFLPYLFLSCLGQNEELLQNPDFEEPFEGNWFCSGCLLEQTDEDSYTGDYSGKVTDR